MACTAHSSSGGLLQTAAIRKVIEPNGRGEYCLGGRSILDYPLDQLESQLGTLGWEVHEEPHGASITLLVDPGIKIEIRPNRAPEGLYWVVTVAALSLQHRFKRLGSAISKAMTYAHAKARSPTGTKRAA